MPISYTNRKGHTYFLCRGVTKTGKPRYFFSKTAAQNSLEEIPSGHHIEESVNGVVSLVKDRNQFILPEEIRVVEAALHRHPNGNNYRITAKGKQIIIYERIGPDVETTSDIFSKTLFTYSRQDLVDCMREILDKDAQFSPILHFNLKDTANRTFWAELVTYVVCLPEWIDIGDCGLLQDLVDQIIPLLDTDEYFMLI